MQGAGALLLAGQIGRWRGILARAVTSPDDLAANMSALYSAIHDTDFAALDVGEVKAIAVPAQEELFDLYLTIKDRLPEWRAHGFASEAGVREVRNAMRVLRYTIDIVGEVGEGYARLGPDEATHSAFTGPGHWTLMHPRLAATQMAVPRAGDVLLVRGQLNNSAAIARIGDVDSQFSHAGIVHIDSDGTAWLVEALIEEGAVLTPLEDALSHDLGRALLLRHRDEVLAKEAAAFAVRLVESDGGRLFGRIPYDFSMELDGVDRLFCSKLLRYGFEGASRGALVLPSFPTRLSMRNRDFLERLGVTATLTFAPGDLEVEPAFDVVAEWRDYRVTSALRIQDLLMSKLFDWMEQHEMRFRERLAISALALLGRLTSWGPDTLKELLVRLGFPKIPSNMPVRTIVTIGMLHQTAQPLLEQLVALEMQRIEATGRPLHPREVQAELERLRAASGGRLGYLVSG